jgi:hypothetical protein
MKKPLNFGSVWMDSKAAVMRFLGIEVVERANSQSVKIYVEKLKQIPLGRIT